VSGAHIILIDGATGYLGSHLTKHLQKNGMSVRCLVRQKANTDNIEFLESSGADVVYGDLHTDKTQLRDVFRGVDAAVHLIGSIAPKRHESFASLHVEATTDFAELCLKSGVKKVIMVTAIGVKAEATSDYLRTKWQAEEILRQSGLNCIFLRPSLLIGRTFGTRDSKLVRRLIDLIESRPIVPLIGGGKNMIQPLFIDDMVAVIKQCIQWQVDDCGHLAPVFELGGPTVLSMKEFLQELMRSIGIEKPLVPVPLPAAAILAILSEMIQEVPIFSQDQLKLSMRDNICDSNALTEQFGITPTSIKDALKSYTTQKADGVLPSKIT
jgi:nucleoside-diphosphate-sugar epimerase